MGRTVFLIGIFSLSSYFQVVAKLKNYDIAYWTKSLGQRELNHYEIYIKKQDLEKAWHVLKDV